MLRFNFNFDLFNSDYFLYERFLALKKELEEMGLAAPQITYIMHALKEKGLPVDPADTTVEEAKQDILHALREMNSSLLKGGVQND